MLEFELPVPGGTLSAVGAVCRLSALPPGATLAPSADLIPPDIPAYLTTHPPCSRERQCQNVSLSKKEQGRAHTGSYR